MKPLIVLLVAFGIAFFAIGIFLHTYDLERSARIAMAIMMMFTAIAHFAFSKGMRMMIPGFIPFKSGMVYGTGVIEIALGIGLLFPATCVLAGWILIIFFLLILPANIYAAIKNVDYQKGTFDGPGLKYLWFRVPLQILFILWTYLSIK
jgi:uncharacterized membrane protein